jgi:membrane protease YdiL (CAAX protease family)
MSVEMRPGWRALLLPILLCIAFAVHAAVPDLELQDSDRRLLQSLDRSYVHDYEQALAWYQRELEAAPYDVVLAIERCRFLSGAMGIEESDLYDRARAEHEACEKSLEASFPGHPEVLLYELEREYGESRIAAGNALVRSQADWNNAQLGRYHAAMAIAHDGQGKTEVARWHAQQALKFDKGADTRLIVAKGQLAEGARDEAIATLTAPLGLPDEAPWWERTARLDLLAQLGAREEVLALHSAMKSDTDSSYDHLRAGLSLARVNALEVAREEMKRAAEERWRGAEGAREAYLFELRFGTATQALEAYNRLRDFGYDQDLLLQYRALLLARDASLPWQLRDAIGALVVAGALAAAALAALFLIMPVHYFGLVRRVKGLGAHAYAGGWNLKHAWAFYFGIGVALLVAGYFAGVPDPGSERTELITKLPQGEGLAQMMLAFAGSLSIVALLLTIGARARGLAWSTEWPPWKAAAFGIGIGLALRTLILLVLPFSSEQPDAEVWRTYQPEIVALAETYGIATMLIVLGLYAPLVEEFLFRRVLLAAFSRHMRFGAANVLQAALFALLHMQPIFLPFLFALGWLAGHLARRSGGLLAPILLHATANLVVAVWYLLATR